MYVCHSCVSCSECSRHCLRVMNNCTCCMEHLCSCCICWCERSDPVYMFGSGSGSGSQLSNAAPCTEVLTGVPIFSNFSKLLLVVRIVCVYTCDYFVIYKSCVLSLCVCRKLNESSEKLVPLEANDSLPPLVNAVLLCKAAQPVVVLNRMEVSELWQCCACIDLLQSYV